MICLLQVHHFRSGSGRGKPSTSDKVGQWQARSRPAAWAASSQVKQTFLCFSSQGEKIWGELSILRSTFKKNHDKQSDLAELMHSRWRLMADSHQLPAAISSISVDLVGWSPWYSMILLSRSQVISADLSTSIGKSVVKTMGKMM